MELPQEAPPSQRIEFGTFCGEGQKAAWLRWGEKLGDDAGTVGSGRPRGPLQPEQPFKVVPKSVTPVLAVTGGRLSPRWGHVMGSFVSLREDTLKSQHLVRASRKESVANIEHLALISGELTVPFRSGGLPVGLEGHTVGLQHRFSSAHTHGLQTRERPSARFAALLSARD